MHVSLHDRVFERVFNMSSSVKSLNKMTFKTSYYYYPGF